MSIDRRRWPEVPGYELVSVIGRGGFGTVYEARQLSVDRPVALKILDAAHIDEPMERRFRAESRAIGALSWHPHVVSLHDAGVTPDGELFLVMELIPGGSLGDSVRAGRALEPATVQTVGIQLADALAAAHDAGVLHRDVKPDNVLVDRRGNYLLGDFGIATLDDGTRSSTGHFTGTYAFSAPELLKGERATERSDLYSLGATLHALATGRPPFAVDTDATPAAQLVRIITEPTPPLPSTIPAPLAEAITGLMSKDPAERPASAADLLQQLQRLPQLGRTALEDDATSTQAPTTDDEARAAATIVGLVAAEAAKPAANAADETIQGPGASLPAASPDDEGLDSGAIPSDQAAAPEDPTVASPRTPIRPASTAQPPRQGRGPNPDGAADPTVLDRPPRRSSGDAAEGDPTDTGQSSAVAPEVHGDEPPPGAEPTGPAPLVTNLDDPVPESGPRRSRKLAGAAAVVAIAIITGAAIVATRRDGSNDAKATRARSTATSTTAARPATSAATTTTPPTTTTTKPPSPFDPAAPSWASAPIAMADAPAALVSSWRAAPDRESCPALTFDDLGEGISESEGAVPRKASSTSWGVAWDVGGAPGSDSQGVESPTAGRSTFGIISAGSDLGTDTSGWPHSASWSDGSHVGYGKSGRAPDDSPGLQWLAYLYVAPQPCLYNVWSYLGRDHLEHLIAHLRRVEGAGA